jgi:hypothetical protein
LASGALGIATFIPNLLSTFVKFNDEKYPGLSTLFDKAGLGNLSQQRI